MSASEEIAKQAMNSIMSKQSTAEKLADTREYMAKNIVPENYSGAIVSFVDDDGYTKFLDRWKPIADAKGFKMSLGINSAYLGQKDAKGTVMTLYQLKQLQKQGFNIISHTNTHGDLASYTAEQLDNELKSSYEWIINNDFGQEENVLVYPYGLTSDQVTIKNAVRKYFNYGIAVNDNVNPVVVDNLCINRIHGDLRDLAGLKSAVDFAENQQTWMVVLTHSWDDSYWSTTKMTQLVDYIQSKGIPILTVNEAIKYKGNVLAIGEYTNTRGAKLHVNRHGESNIGIKVIGDALVYNTNSNIGLFDQGKVTIVPIFTTNDLLLGVGGVMEVHRIPPNDDFSYAYYKPATRNELYRNHWNTSTGNWDGWVRIATPTSHLINNNVAIVNMDDPISSYVSDCETIVPLVTAKDTYLHIGGVMKVYRSSLQNFSYATYTPYNVNSLYMRKWVEGSSSWGAWTKIGGA